MAGFKFTIKFVLQQTEDASKDTAIRCWVRFNNNRAMFPTGIYDKPKNWKDTVTKPGEKPQKTGELKKGVRYPDYERVSEYLKKVEGWVKMAFEHLTVLNSDYPEPDELKDLCLHLIKSDGLMPGSKPKAKPLTFLEYIDVVIEDTKKGRRTKKDGSLLSPGMAVSYTTTLNVLKSYLKFASKQTLLFEDINLEFYYDFKDWSYNIENFTDNYFGKNIKNIKAFMNEGLRADPPLHSNLSHRGERFITVKADVENIYLDQNQLSTIANFDFSKNPKLERVRDLFLVGCWTGLRFSDFNNIQPKSFIQTEHGPSIEIKTQKTGETVTIPIHNNLKQIMARYEGKTANSLPPPMSNVKLNEYIKEAAQETKQLSVITSLEKARAGKKIIVSKPLHELISTHTARRAFASNMFKMGVPTLVIMAVTGHRTDKAFLTYIKVSSREKSEMMREVWNRNNLKIASA